MNSYPTFIHSPPFYRYDLVPNYKHFTDWDRCTECNVNSVQYTCNNCRNHVCNNQKCSISFPHYNNTCFVICNTCKIPIENKLVCIEHDKLRLLKKKIQLKIQQRAEEKMLLRKPI